MNEWLKIMLEEIHRKREQQEADRDEHHRRIEETNHKNRSGETPSRRDQQRDN